METLVFEPLIKQIRWGGRKLGDLLGKAIGTAGDYAESWEIADQPSGQSVVAAGAYKKMTLSDLVENLSDDLLGRHHAMQQFPLLIKYLDANDWLSLQVHPNDEQAKEYDVNENGKNEAWVILDAEPDSQIVSGLNSGVTRDDFEQHLRAGTVEETLHMIPAKVGDCIFVPAQTVHALGPGILLAEVQQQSNLTFRLHDWGRLGSDGQPREIHVKESLACIDFERGPVKPVTPVELSDGRHHFQELVRCNYFVIRRHHAVDEFDLKLDDRFRILMLLDGNATVSTDACDTGLVKGTTALLPASTTRATIHPEGSITLLEVLYP